MIDNFQEAVQSTLNAMSTGLKYPVMVLLILLAAWTLFLLGTLIVEVFQEHRHLKVNMPSLIEEIRRAGKGHVEECIQKSKLLKRQKAALTEITKHPEISDMMRESLAVRLVTEEQGYYDARTKRTDLIAKIGPMLGLMGTLIPLGPGVIALGQGDTYTLSTSLLIAFDTTVTGLACAGVALCISTVRKKWYSNYMSMLETLMECILDEENRGDKETVDILRKLQLSMETEEPHKDHQKQAELQRTAESGTGSDKPAAKKLTDAQKAAIIKALRQQQLKEQAEAAERAKAMKAVAAKNKTPDKVPETAVNQAIVQQGGDVK